MSDEPMTSEITVEQMHTFYGKQHDALCEWAVANGLDPTQISASYPIQVIGDEIHYRAKPRSLSEQLVLNAESNIDYPRQVAPLIVPMPETWPTGD